MKPPKHDCGKPRSREGLKMSNEAATIRAGLGLAGERGGLGEGGSPTGCGHRCAHASPALSRLGDQPRPRPLPSRVPNRVSSPLEVTRAPPAGGRAKPGEQRFS